MPATYCGGGLFGVYIKGGGIVEIDKTDMDLLVRELTRLYGVEVAQEIMLKERDNLFEGTTSVAYSLGKRSIKFFALFYLREMFMGDGKASLSDTHYESWQELTDMFLGEGVHNKRNYLFPRGFGKTAILSTPTVIWAHCYGHSTLTVLGSAVKDTATAFMMSIKEGFRSKRIVNTFGELMDDNLINNTEKLELTNDSMIMVASTRTTLRGVNYKGNRINLLVLDDYMSEENTTTKEAMDKHWNLFIKNVLPAVEKHKHWVLGFGTTQKRGDFYNRLENDPTFITSRKPAIPDISILEKGHWKKFRDILFSDKGLIEARRYYEQHRDEMEYKRIWDYFSCLDMAVLYYSDPMAFMQEYQLELRGSEEKKFTNITYNESIENANVLVIDPATSNNKENDYTAFVIGKYEDDKIQVEYGEIDRLDFDEYVSRTVNILKEYPSIDTVIVEKQTYNRADVIAMKNVIQRDMKLYHRRIKWVNEHQSKNKDNKINSIVGDVNLGRVQFHTSMKDTEPIEQLMDFTTTQSSQHDDFPDALAELVIYLKEDNLNSGTVEVYDMALLF